MTKICKRAVQHFHWAVSKVFDRVKSVALWSANIRKLAEDHKGYGSAAKRVIDQIVTLRKTLSTDAKPRLTMSFSKGNNLIYHPLNYMLFNLLYWMFSLSRLQWCFFHFNVSFHVQSIQFYRRSVILLEPRILNHPGRLKSLHFQAHNWMNWFIIIKLRL
jgi:hypothetical protein